MKESVFRFEELTGYDLTSYLDTYALFVHRYSKDIVGFYTGVTYNVERAFETLNTLTTQSVELRSLIEARRRELTESIQSWDLLEMITDIDTSLQTHNNMQKWVRSSISKAHLSEGVRVDVALKMNQTLENLSIELGAIDKESYWFKIALSNDLREEDYTLAGGNNLSVSGSNKRGVYLNSVLDTNITGKKIYGIDIKKKFEFSEDDFVVLDYDRTLFQTVDTLVRLKKGDTPEYMDEGIQANLLGGNRNTVPFPVLLRQYYYTFSKDDSFKSITIKNIEYVQDSLFLTMECETRIGEAIEQTISL